MRKYQLGPPLKCEGFDSPCDVESDDVLPESSRTQYVWNGIGEDPNRDRLLCRDCAQAHHAHWDGMWAGVWGSV